MDRRWSLAALLISGIAAGASFATPIAGLELREARWLSPDRRLAALSSEPAECSSLPQDKGERARFALGRSLFRNPMLLGGQAARAGLSCASCHRNGRGNPDFLFPGLSGAEGTADVTSSLLSRTRGDGVFNPVHIPDLARDPPKVSREANNPALTAFIRGLVVDEFDGREPPPGAIEGLAAYVRAIRATSCLAEISQPVRLGNDVGEILLTLSAARDAANRSEPALARLIVSGARDRLGMIAARYTGQKRALKSLGNVDRSLARLQTAIDEDPLRASTKLSEAEARLTTARSILVQTENQSLYAPPALEAWLAR